MVSNIKMAILIAFVLIFSSASLPVLAQEGQGDTGSNNDSQETTVTEEQATTQSPESEPETENTLDRKTRLDTYRVKLEEKLSAAQERRIVARCKSAQGKITSLQAKVNNAVANREKVYSEIGDKLNNLIKKLQAAGVDTTEIEVAQEDIATESQSLLAAFEDYETVLADVAAMNCEEDAEGFKAALEVARQKTTELRAQAEEFRKMVTGDLKEILQNIRQDLETDNDENETEDDQASTDGDQTGEGI